MTQLARKYPAAVRACLGLLLARLYKIGGAPLFTNYDHVLNYQVAERIKGRPLLAIFKARDFSGMVWWFEDVRLWCIEIWFQQNFVATHIAETIEDLIEEIQEEYGDE